MHKTTYIVDSDFLKKTLLFLLLLNGILSCSTKRSYEKGYFKVTARSGLILRSGPGQSFEKTSLLKRNTIGQIDEYVGSPVTIAEKRGQWLAIKTNELEGFIFSAHVLISENLESFEENQPVVPFITLDNNPKEIKKKALELYKDFDPKKSTLQTGVISSNQDFTISFFGLHDISKNLSYASSPSSIYIKNLNSNYIEIPDMNNFYPISQLENGRIISGSEHICFECCAHPEPVIHIIGKQKSFSIFTSDQDTEGACPLEAQAINFNRIRISDSKNEIYIHKKYPICEFTSSEECFSSEEGVCKANQFSKELFIVIQDPYENPVLKTYKEIPLLFQEDFKKSRKLKPLKKISLPNRDEI